MSSPFVAVSPVALAVLAKRLRRRSLVRAISLAFAGDDVPDARCPAVIVGSQFVYDLNLGGYVFGFAFNDQPQA